MATSKKAIVQIAKDRARGNAPVQLSTGYYAILTAVSPNLIDEAHMTIPQPEVPLWYNEDKGREEENYNHPQYLAAVERANVDKVMASLDTMIMFGVEIVNEDGTPYDIDSEGDKWAKMLCLLERRGRISLDGLDIEDAVDREYLFKKYIAIGPEDAETIFKTSITEEDISLAAKSFRGDEERDAD